MKLRHANRYYHSHLHH
jgi:hypothetical protein